MKVKEAIELSYDEIRSLYKQYLQTQGLSSNTVQTAYNDTFYLWRHGSKELFWEVVTSEEFEKKAKEELFKVLEENSSVGGHAYIGGYLSHLRRFQKYISENNSVNVENRKVTEENVKTHSVQIRKRKIDIPKPSCEQIEIYLEKWAGLENYHLQEDALDKLFLTLCPENKTIEDILIKVATLNDFYSTNIFSVYPVAKHILQLDIDTRLKAGDVTLVAEIQKVTVGDVERNHYSFATKYCSHHKPLDYPIYDSYVEKVLKYFRNVDGFSQFADNDLKNYIKFKAVLIDFREFYGLEKYNLKQIDQYIWQLGKEYFPKKYYKK